jgi:hypothetical protein
MGKYKIALAALVLAALAAAALGVGPNRTVLVLKDGSVIPVDRLWDSGNDLIYENAHETRFVNRADIRAIERRDLPHQLRALGANALGAGARAYDALASVLRRAAARAGIFLLLVAAAALGIGALWFWRRPARRRPAVKSPPKPAPPPPRGLDEELPNRVDIVRFFLNHFRSHLGAAADAPADFTQLPSPAPGPDLVYELRVRHCGDWVKRRMTIGPLGEDSGSRSKCYRVIFDKHLVVKIPPRPVVDFEEYVASIRKEGGIVARLAPRECIVPMVSVILGQVHPPPGDGSVPADRLEEHYVALLQKSPVLQEHLKIRGTFAYFMDLSRYYFLSHIIDSLHDLSTATRTEIATTTELIRYPDRFKERYPKMDEAVGFAIRDLFHQCEAEVRHLFKAHSRPGAMPAYRIQTWFLSHLETGGIGDDGGEVSPELTAAVQTVFQRLFDKHRASVDSYLESVRHFTHRLTLGQNKAVLSGIISHMLDLLGWLAAKEVAMRDLKPDNILVAGDPQNYPAFLRTPADYSLGFIDVETAADFSRVKDRKIPQPLLGGTPYFATPAHLFSNAALDACFGDAGRILHFQDWQAVLVMVYKVVTGELLFDRTAKLFVDIKTRIVSAMKRADCLDGQIGEASREFWQSAAEEFRVKMRAREDVLRIVEAEIPAGAKSMFLEVLRGEIEAMTQDIEQLVKSQTYFNSASARERLLKTSSQRIFRIMEEIDSGALAAGAAGGEAVRAGRPILRQLATRKALLERKVQLAAALPRKGARVSAYDLLLFMFNSVLRRMYREDWLPDSRGPAGDSCPPRDELSLATTI